MTQASSPPLKRRIRDPRQGVLVPELSQGLPTQPITTSFAATSSIPSNEGPSTIFEVGGSLVPQSLMMKLSLRDLLYIWPKNNAQSPPPELNEFLLTKATQEKIIPPFLDFKSRSTCLIRIILSLLSVWLILKLKWPNLKFVSRILKQIKL